MFKIYLKSHILVGHD